MGTPFFFIMEMSRPEKALQIKALVC